MRLKLLACCVTAVALAEHEKHEGRQGKSVAGLATQLLVPAMISAIARNTSAWQMAPSIIPISMPLHALGELTRLHEQKNDSYVSNL